MKIKNKIGVTIGNSTAVEALMGLNMLLPLGVMLGSSLEA